MDKQNLSESTLICSPKFDISSITHINCENTMPDYFAPIRKVISLEAAPLPDSKFLSGETLEYGGTLSVTVTYIGEDGAISAYPCSIEYSGNTVLPEEASGTGEIYIDAFVFDENVRVLAPRKIALSAKVKSRIYANKYLPCELFLEASDEKSLSSDAKISIQYLKKSVPTVKRGFSCLTGKATSEEEGSEKLRMISASGEIKINSVSPLSNAVNIKGDVIIKCFSMTEGGAYKTTKFKIPLEENIITEGITSSDSARAFGRAASVSIREREGGGFDCSCEYDLVCEWAREGEASLCFDTYSTDYAYESEYLCMQSVSLLHIGNHNLSVNSKAKRKSGGKENEAILDTRAKAKFEKAEIKDGKLIYTGNLSITVLISGEGDVICEEINEPIKYEAPIKESAFDRGEIIFFSDAFVTDISAVLDGNEISYNAELFMSFGTFKKAELCPVSKIKIDEESRTKEDKAEIKVFYPQGNETLWEIAKKYTSDIETTEKINKLKRTDHSENNPIIIPM